MYIKHYLAQHILGRYVGSVRRTPETHILQEIRLFIAVMFNLIAIVSVGLASKYITTYVPWNTEQIKIRKLQYNCILIVCSRCSTLIFSGGLFLYIFVGFECDASLQCVVVLMMMICLGI